MFSVACYATLHPALSIPPSVQPSIHSSIGASITLFSQHLCFFWACHSYPNALLTSNMAPYRPHATGVALYLALLVADWLLYKRLCPSISQSVTLCAQVEKTSISCPPIWDWYWLSFLVKTYHFFYNGMSASKKIFFCVYQTLVSSFSFIHIVVFMKCQKWCF